MDSTISEFHLEFLSTLEHPATSFFKSDQEKCFTGGGYDLDWVEDPPDDLKCQICLCVARDPHQHPGDVRNRCGKVFCSDCISKYQRNNSTCPNCEQKLTLFLDSRSDSNIKALKVKCDNLNNGCDWTGELGSLETHLELQPCDYTLLPCTNQCETDNDIPEFLRKDLPNHLANDCPRRQYECPHCQETGEYQERTTTHLETCPKVKVHCPNANCQDMIARCDVQTHRSTCAYESVPCKYAAVGCEEKPLRKDLTKHEENDQLHLRVRTERILVLTKINSHLLKSTSLTPCTLKLTNYQQWKSDDKRFISPPFYTSYSGYKMCLRVDANGCGDAAGTHVSVYAYLMKGDHDDTLTWPFSGIVTIKLLNQLEDKNHHTKITTFPADSVGSKRVVDRERAVKGYGRSTFISHAALGYDTRLSANTQYLKNDTLVFRVSTKIPDHKPWLECTT